MLFLKNYIRRRRDNFNLLRQICGEAGPLFEARGYDELLALSEENFPPMERRHDGFTVAFSGEASLEKNGDILFFLNLHSDLPTLFGVKPGWHFYKRKDGSVYY